MTMIDYTVVVVGTDGSRLAEPTVARASWLAKREDADLVASLGLDDYRFSLEWSRIEPADGEFSQAALDHYARVCEGLRERGIDPVVTFHHFTSPRWIAQAGGWAAPGTADRFAAFVERAAARLDGLVTRACTINEPNIVSFCGYALGVFPPGRTDGVMFHPHRVHRGLLRLGVGRVVRRRSTSRCQRPVAR